MRGTKDEPQPVDFTPPEITETEVSPEQKFQEWIDEEERKCFLTPIVIEGGRVVVKTDKFHYSGRIAIPDTAKRMPSTGHVVRVSDIDKYGDLLGKRVVYGVYAGTPVTFKGQSPYRLIDTREILAIVELEDVELEDIE